MCVCMDVLYVCMYVCMYVCANADACARRSADLGDHGWLPRRQRHFPLCAEPLILPCKTRCLPPSACRGAPAAPACRPTFRPSRPRTNNESPVCTSCGCPHNRNRSHRRIQVGGICLSDKPGADCAPRSAQPPSPQTPASSEVIAFADKTCQLPKFTQVVSNSKLDSKFILGALQTVCPTAKLRSCKQRMPKKKGNDETEQTKVKKDIIFGA